MLTRVFFVRHAQPDYAYADDRSRPLTEEGAADSALVLETLKDRRIDAFYSSPYRRSIDTIRPAAEHFGKTIQTDERLRERKAGPHGNTMELFHRRWADHRWHEDGGEALETVQKRNIAALEEILAENRGKNLVLGTHGTALSTIIHYYVPQFGCGDFLRILDWMPYIVEMDFEDQRFVSMAGLAHREKIFHGKP